MRFALVPKFHGTNCDTETLSWLGDNLEVHARYLEPGSDAGIEASKVACVVVPGGFSYGDYLRAGALAARSPSMKVVARLAAEGVPVLGVCNGFQILCEAGLLPGVLLKNANRQHNHFPVRMRTEFEALRAAEAASGGEAASVWLPRLSGPHAAAFEALYSDVSIPMSCGMGRYAPPRSQAVVSEAGRESLAPGHTESFRVVFRYVHNENGAFDSIAGIARPDGRVLGLMPHPERASDPLVGGTQGLMFLLGLAENTGPAIRKGSPLEDFAAHCAARSGSPLLAAPRAPSPSHSPTPTNAAARESR